MEQTTPNDNIKKILLWLIGESNKNLNKVSRKGNLNISDVLRILSVLTKESLSTFLHFAKSHMNPSHFEELKKIMKEDLIDQINNEEEENNEDN